MIIGAQLVPSMQQSLVNTNKAHTDKSAPNVKSRQAVDDTHATFIFPEKVFPIKPREYVVILGISPQEKYHRKNHFKTTVQLLKAVFPRLRVILIIGDWVLAESLHKENSKWSPEKCMQEAKIEGDNWLTEVQQDGYLIITKFGDVKSNIANQQAVITIDEKDIIRGSDFFENGRYTNDYKLAETEIIELLNDEDSDAKHRVNSYLGNRKQKYRNLSQSQQIWFEEKDKEFIYKEMVAQQVVIKRFPEVDFVLYPGKYPLPFSALYDNARSKHLLPVDKHSWVTIKFLTELKVQDRNRILIHKINDKQEPQLDNPSKLGKKIDRSEIMPTTSTQTLFGQKPNSEEKISKTTEVTVEFGTETNVYELSTKKPKKSVSEEKSYSTRVPTVTVKLDDLQSLISMAMVGTVLANPNNISDIVKFMRSLPLQSASSELNHNEKKNQNNSKENVEEDENTLSPQEKSLKIDFNA